MHTQLLNPHSLLSAAAAWSASANAAISVALSERKSDGFIVSGNTGQAC